MLHYSDIIPQEEIKNILPLNIIKQWRKQNILLEGDTLTSIPCLECSNCFSKVEKTEAGIQGYCETYNDFYDLPELYSEFAYKFNTNNFFSLFKEKFKIRGTLKEVNTNFYYIGFSNIDHIHVFFSFDTEKDVYLKNINENYSLTEKAIVILSSSFFGDIFPKDFLYPVFLDDIVKMTSRSISWDIDEFNYVLQNKFREVEFTKDGQLIYNSLILRDYQFGDNEYAFLKTLWDNFGRATSYETIFNYAKKTVLILQYTDAKSFAEKIKSNICGKDSQNKKIVEKIIVNAKDIGSKKGYRMVNPQN